MKAVDDNLINLIAKIVLKSNHIYIRGLGSDGVAAKCLFAYIRK